MKLGKLLSFFFFFWRNGHLLVAFFFLIYFWLRWVFVAVRGLSLVAASRGYSLLGCAGFSSQWLLLLRNIGSRAQAQQLRRTGPVALRHVGSSRTRARTCGPCIGRRILNHCATREALLSSFEGDHTWIASTSRGLITASIKIIFFCFWAPFLTVFSSSFQNNSEVFIRFRYQNSRFSLSSKLRTPGVWFMFPSTYSRISTRPGVKI